MRRTRFTTISLAVVLTLASCNKQQSDTDAIRSGIVEHLHSLKSINVSAMDINVTSVNIQGNQAQAQVEFRPKNGAPSGGGMQVSYSLEKQNEIWVVSKTLGTGGMIEHPAPGTNPHLQSGQTSAPGVASSPAIQDLLHWDALKPSSTLPPGHPPVSPSAKPNSEAHSE